MRGEKRTDLVDIASPCRFGRQREMVAAVDLDEPGLRDPSRHHQAEFNRNGAIASAVQHQLVGTESFDSNPVTSKSPMARCKRIAFSGEVEMR